MKSKIIILSALAALAASACGRTGETPAADTPQFVTVGEDGKFHIGDSTYTFVGANFWYGPILASTGRGGDRELLARELDAMQELGIGNLRILVGGDGPEGLYAHIMPVLQPRPGEYNDTLLDGLDYLIAELEKRDMKAVLFLNNSWEWSGGYSAYVEWATGKPALIPAIDGYREYCDYVSEFIRNDSAKALANDHVRYIVGRENRYTGKPYSQSPAIMSWQICNEPRPFGRDSLQKELFYDYLISTARIIHEVDTNHMVSVGSEGAVGCEFDLDLWKRIHDAPEIDYATIHIWPFNWGVVNIETMADSIDSAIEFSYDYITEHTKYTSKPIVVEEFGYPRDGKQFAIGTPVEMRDKYYRAVFAMADSIDGVEGANFWAWGGLAHPQHEEWTPWDPYTGDPAQEPQGLYSVFATDSSTISIIREAARKQNK